METWGRLALLSCLAWTGAATGAAHGVTFSLSPSSITNDYVGEITFTIGGLAPGQTVVVEKYADLNGNGTVDAGETASDRFALTDGQVPLIAGVRDLNRPGDEDGAANGAIMATDFYTAAPLTGIAGSYLYVLSDPAHTFTPLVRPFAVNQHTSLPQGIRGRVTAADSGQPIAHVVVLLSESGQFIVRAGVFADADGRYTLYTAPGSYTVVPLSPVPGYVANVAMEPTAVPAGQFVPRDVTMGAAGVTVSGMASDQASGAGLGFIDVLAQSSSGLLSVAFTGSDGRYTLKVTPGDWQISPKRGSPERTGHVTVVDESFVTISGDFVQNFPLPKATSLIYGTVQDATARPVPGLDMGADAGPYQARGHTFPILPPAPNYSIDVVGGDWEVAPNGDDLAAAGCRETENVPITLADGEAVRRDFTLECTAVPTPTATTTPPTPTATKIPGACAGDCNGDGSVKVNELITMVNIALGIADVSACIPGDANNDGAITISEIVTAVTRALYGC